MKMLILNLTEETIFIDINEVCGYSVNVDNQITQVLMKYGEWQTITSCGRNNELLMKHFKFEL